MADPARLLLTRPLAQARDWSERLAALGVPTLAFPLIDIVAADDPAPARGAWASLPEVRLVMFVSPNAVRHFFEHRPADHRWPANVLAATVGPGSAQALMRAGVPAGNIVQPPPESDMLDSEHLWPEIQRVAGSDWRGRAALLVRGDGGREWLADRLREAGAEVRSISVYRRQCPVLDDASRARLTRALSRPAEHIWLFSSSEAVGYLESMAAGATKAARSSPESGTAPTEARSGTLPPQEDYSLGTDLRAATAGTDWTAVRAIATHERIAARARALGLLHVVLVRPDARAVADAFRRLAGTPLESPT